MLTLVHQPWVPSPRFRRMNYVESYPSVVSKPIQKWTLTEIGKNSTVTTTLRETRSDSCSKCTKGGAISVEIRVTTRRLSPPIDDEEEDRTSPQLRNDCDWRWPEGLAPLLNLDAHLSLRNWEVMLPHCGLSEHTFRCGIGRWKEIKFS